MATITTPSTTANASASASASPSSDYQTLLAEIKNTIDRNDQLFQQIQLANYPNAGNYQSDLLNYKIDTTVNDLTKTRQQIWEFLNKKYQENTKLRAYYFNEIRKADAHIAELTKQQQVLIKDIQAKKLQTTTSNKRIRHLKYEYDKKEYYLFLYKTLIILQICILVILSLSMVGIIPRSTGLILTLIILLATLAFVGYYVFYINIGRSTFSWRKFEHDNNIKSIGEQCVDNTGVSQTDKQKASVDKAVQELIDTNKTATKCTSAPEAGATPTSQ